MNFLIFLIFLLVIYITFNIGKMVGRAEKFFKKGKEEAVKKKESTDNIEEAEYEDINE